jgi:prepilin-type processing-associated H-X9-DG protein
MAGLKDSIARIFICPADKLERGRTSFQRSYAYVPWACNLTQFAEDIPRGFAHLTPNKGVPPSAIISPSTSAIIVEWHAGTDTIENCLGHGNHQYHGSGGEASGRDPREKCHAGTQNVLFCDGHVENVPIMEHLTFAKKYWPLDTRFNPATP